MNVLIIAPVIYSVTPDNRYAGIERLCGYWAKGLHDRGYKVTLAAAQGSRVPSGIQLIETPQGDFSAGERNAYFIYRPRLQESDAIFDFSHSHIAMRENKLPAACWIWHDPGIQRVELPNYGVKSLSFWQKRRLQLFQGNLSDVFDCHCGPTPEVQEAGDYFVFIGRPTPTKGMMQAVDICRAGGFKCYLIGGLGLNDDKSYLEAIKAKCGDGIEYLGQVSDEAKNEILSRARALIYPINYPPFSGESHSHKSVDAALQGIPLIAYDQGALREVFGASTGCTLVSNQADFIKSMDEVRTDMEYRQYIQACAAERWSPPKVMDRAEELIKEIANG